MNNFQTYYPLAVVSLLIGFFLQFELDNQEIAFIAYLICILCNYFALQKDD